MNITKLPLTLRPDASRVLIRPFWPSGEVSHGQNSTNVPRALKIMTRILALSDDEAETLWAGIMADFHERHPNLDDYFLNRFTQVSPWLPTDAPISRTRKLIIGSYFTHEYSLEAAALFNPSVVEAPDQTGVPEGCLRVVLALRAVGEGHISSICFRAATLTSDFNLEIGEPARYVVEASRDVDASFEVIWFQDRCHELGLNCDFLDRVLGQLPAHFTESQLKEAIRKVSGSAPDPADVLLGERLMMLAKSNFSVHFTPHQRYSERAIFPVSPSQTNGIEDARFVKFVEEDGSITFYATYTAYDGRVIFPQILETKDFLHFHFRTLQGAAVQNKGLALFPRRINGNYVMLSRQDAENIRIMFSDDLYSWDTSEVLARPTRAWEFVQMGNCGSPLETPEGWIVLTHGVGAMRKYCIGAMLLDLNDPTKIIGRMPEPLIRPEPEEREGYVPNVVYSCGGMIHRGMLFLPYATSDWFTSFAIISVRELLDAMVPTEAAD